MPSVDVFYLREASEMSLKANCKTDRLNLGGKNFRDKHLYLRINFLVKKVKRKKNASLLRGKRCATSQITAAKETRKMQKQTKFKNPREN